jgi:hypothetical protein
VKVFISYSVADTDLLRQVIGAVRAGGDEVFCWETSRVPGNGAWASIFQWIDQADLVVVIITDQTVSRAMSVGQEVGRALAKSKPVLPLVAAGVRSSDLGCLNGVIYQPISRENTSAALAAVQRVIEGMKLKKAEEKKQLLVVGGIVGLLWLMGQNG